VPEFEEVLKIIEAKKFPVLQYVSKYAPLSQVQEMMDYVADASSLIAKVILLPHPDEVELAVKGKL
jgi:hypothetical protein